MEPFSPDLIAQIATKLYREGAHTSESSPPRVTENARPSLGSIRDLLPTQPGIPPISAIPGHSEDLHFPKPSLPSSSVADANTQYSVPISAPIFFKLSAPVPSQSARSSVRPTVVPRRVKPMTADGLQRFVQGVQSQRALGREDCLGGGHDRFATQTRGSSISALPLSPASQFSVEAVRKDFPVLNQRVHGFPLAWLDNAATTQKPQVVIDAISHFYQTDNSNIHRAAHSLAARATEAYELSRQAVAAFLGARSDKDIVFARGTTEAINLVANTYGARYLKKGDEILLSVVEHHANIVPWQMIAKRKGAEIRVIPVNDRGEIIMDEYIRLLNPRTRIVSLTHASNSLGTILPVVEMTALAKRYNARVLIDGAQSVSHMPINVQAMGCDFFVFSGHKIFAPTGIGALYVTEELHDVLPPWQGGGNMIKNVTFEKTTYAEAPAKFEAGTPNIADAVGLRAALEYVQRIGLSNIAAHEHSLTEHATQKLTAISGLRIIGTAREKVSVISFVLEGHSTEEIGKALDHAGIAVRSGHHCAQPSLRRFGVETTVRPSFSLYNTHEEVDRMVDVVQRLARTNSMSNRKTF
jgi:cysteine desulfurase/selenocysteine lyase